MYVVECYRVVLLSFDPNDLTVYDSIDFGFNKKAAYDYCIYHDWQYNDLILDIEVSYEIYEEEI